MKALYTLLLILQLPLFVQAQQNIAGSWEVNLSESLKRMRNDMKAKYDTLPDQAKNNISESFTNRTFTFESDGSVMVQWQINNTPKQFNGTWEYNSGQNKLIIKTEDNLQREYEITRLTPSVLILKMEEDGGIFRELYLKRKS